MSDPNNSASSDDLERDLNADVTLAWETIDQSLKVKELEQQLKEYEWRMTAFQSDIFAKTAENRRLVTRIKDLEEK